MLMKFEEVIKKAKKREKNIISVAVANDVEVLKSVRQAKDLDIADAVLIGNKEEIENIAFKNNIKICDFEIIDIKDKVEACRKSVEIVSIGYADMLMKGLVDSSIILKAVLDKENGIRDRQVISHVSVFEIKGYDRFLYLTDGAMNINPDMDTKKQIIKNAIKVANVLGNTNPKVACLCAVEKVNHKMQATLDAAELVKLNRNGDLKGCVVGGPFALDNAISIRAAKHKGIDDPVAGKADIILVPNIEVGNSLHKSIVFLAEGKSAGIVMGAKVPIIMTSRADTGITKLQSIALGVLIVNQ